VTRKRNKFDLPIILSPISRSNQKEEVGTRALVDSGAEDNFIYAIFTKLMGFKTLPLDEPIKVYNVDGTRNKEGTITEFVQIMMEVQGMHMRVDLLVTGLGRNKVILGIPWLGDVNPDIDWRTGILRWREPAECIDGEDCSDDEEKQAENSNHARFVANYLLCYSVQKKNPKIFTITT
jgi:hypothetical protein